MAGNDLPAGFSLDPAPKTIKRPPPNQSPPPGFELDAAPEKPPAGFELDSEEPQTSTLGASAEGALRGLTGPAAPYVESKLSELGVPNISPQEQAKRQAEHPLAAGLSEAGALIGGALIPGVGEYTLGAKVGQLAGMGAELTSLGRVGSGVIRGAIEAGALQGSDEVSKHVLGQSDPEAPVAAALTHGAWALLGGGLLGGAAGKIGSALENIAKSKAAGWAAKFAADAGATFNLLNNKGDIPSVATDEATNIFKAVRMASEGAYKLKDASAEKLTKSIDPQKISAFSSALLQDLEDVSQQVKGNSSFQEAYNELKGKLTPTKDILGGVTDSPAAHDVFDAVNTFKQKIQAAAKYGYEANAETAPLYNGLRNVANKVKVSLEDVGTWGEMGKFQKELNGAFSPLQKLQDDFLSTFGGKKAGDAVIDPDKVASLLRQVGRDKGALKASKVFDYLDPAKKYLSTVDKIFQSHGLESEIPPVSTDVLGSFMGQGPSPGADFMHWFFNTGPQAIGHAAATTAGTVGGSMLGGVYPYAGYRLAEQTTPFFTKLLTKPTRAAISATLRGLASGDYAGIPDAINYANSISRGTKAIDSAVGNVFVKGGQQYMNSSFSEKDREKLKKHVEDGVQQQQIQNQGKQPPVPAKPQKFAHGGKVTESATPSLSKKPAGVAADDEIGHIATIFPEHALPLGAAKSRINGYLNQIRPQEDHTRLPFDEKMHSPEHERNYNHALDIANKPLSVLDHIKAGTISPDHVQHLNAMYPELANHLRSKLSEKIVEAQQKGEKPPYHVRQGISLFMGTPADSSLSQQNIQAAQATFVVQQAMNQQAAAARGMGKAKGEKLTDLANQHRTSEQAALQRQDRSKV